MYKARLPFNLKMLNMAGRSLRLIGIRGASLNPRYLLRRARRTTNLNDFGPDDFREGLDTLCHSLETEAKLTAFGRLIAQAEILHALENRLKLIHSFKVNRELSGSPISRPLIITGVPHAGSSLLHDLLAQDPDNRVPLSWEMRYPFPPPRTETYQSDARIARVNRELKNAQRLMPEIKRLYPMGAQRPQECVSITAMNLTSMNFGVNYRVPSYQRWLNNHADFRGAYNLHYQFLQHLQYRHKTERWVLMSNGHLWHLEALLKRYPDALIVQIHRDPLKSVCALSNLTYTLRSLASNTPDLKDIARNQADLVAEGLDRNLKLRQSGVLPAKQVLDIHYQDIHSEPLAVVQRIYQHFKLPLADAALDGMQALLDTHDYVQFDRHRYHFMATGLRLEEERRRYKPYMDYFKVPQERV
ncbi:soluble cytochrome b562 [Litorivivens lipolytica]|uniref:Soluble cytochrome b562 n=1 Tax=Litorivivens lipolytica TaxID=1524264 RepID=A0A7W4W405_9GAMM|nr:sulfotransferase [Litorivivens lipolytica]MBB3047048.1 soluble cytochrome b562 [Litorivivens lipolytica]